MSASGAFDMGKFWSVFIGMFDSTSGFDHCADDQPTDYRNGERDADAGNLCAGNAGNNNHRAESAQ